MIQRIQSLFLLGAAVSVLLLLVVPFAIEPLENDGSFSHTVLSGFNHGVDSYQTWALMALIAVIVSSLLAIFTLLQYKNRKRQLGLILVLYICLIAVAFCVHTMTGNFALDAAEGAERGVGYFLPIAGLICAALASIFIRKDERLVKSLDRIR